MTRTAKVNFQGGKFDGKNGAAVVTESGRAPEFIFVPLQQSAGSGNLSCFTSSPDSACEVYKLDHYTDGTAAYVAVPRMAVLQGGRFDKNYAEIQLADAAYPDHLYIPSHQKADSPNLKAYSDRVRTPVTIYKFQEFDGSPIYQIVDDPDESSSSTSIRRSGNFIKAKFQIKGMTAPDGTRFETINLDIDCEFENLAEQIEEVLHELSRKLR